MATTAITTQPEHLGVPSDNIWVGGLPGTCTQEEVTSCFQVYGEVVQCKVMPPSNGRPTASALVRFATQLEAGAALESIGANGNMIPGLETPVVFKYAHGPKTAGAGAWGQQSQQQWQQPQQQWKPTAQQWQAPQQPQQQWQQPQQQTPGDNVFISGLPADFTDDHVRSIFEPYGTVVQCRSLPPKAASATSCALVRFGSVSEATWIVDNLSGNLPDGLDSPIECKYSHGGNKGAGKGSSPPGVPAVAVAYQGAAAAQQHQQQNRPGAAGMISALMSAGSLGPIAKSVPTECQLYVKGLPSDMSDLDMHDMFGPFGAIPCHGVKAMLHPDGTCRGVGFVDFFAAEAAQAAVSTLNGAQLPDGQTLWVSLKKASGGKGAGAQHY